MEASKDVPLDFAMRATAAFAAVVASLAVHAPLPRSCVAVLAVLPPLSMWAAGALGARGLSLVVRAQLLRHAGLVLVIRIVLVASRFLCALRVPLFLSTVGPRPLPSTSLQRERKCTRQRGKDSQTALLHALFFFSASQLMTTTRPCNGQRLPPFSPADLTGAHCSCYSATRRGSPDHSSVHCWAHIGIAERITVCSNV